MQRHYIKILLSDESLATIWQQNIPKNQNEFGLDYKYGGTTNNND